jgi:hypothetical protein
MPVDLSFFMTEPPPADPEPIQPKGKPRKVEIQTIIWDRKREKAHDKAMKMGFKAIGADFRVPKGKPMTPAERRELRTMRQRERRASKALSEAIL